MTTQPSDWAVARAFWEAQGKLHRMSVARAFSEEVMDRARELDASGGGHGVPPEVVGSFVERAAQIISGAPFPSGRSLYKARQISDLALSMYATPRTAKAGDKDGERYRWLRDQDVRFNLSPKMWGSALDEAIDAAMGAVGAGGGE